MADVRAFRGFRYDLGRVGALSDVVAPPYDVIDAALQQSLYQRSPYNAIRLELTKEEPGDADNENRYTRAARTLNEWQFEGVLKQDSLRGLYAIEQEFQVEGKTYQRRGFMARVRLEPFDTGRIFPHEQTMSAPKEDRLKLYRATAMNISPIFGLYPDENNEIFGKLESTLFRTPPVIATDHLGVTSKISVILDEAIITSVIGAMTAKPIFIADGHHRYETGLRYLEERRAAGEVVNDEAAVNFTMMMLVSMNDPGLVILPTHRLIQGFPGLTSEKLRAALEPVFQIENVGSGEAAAQETWERIEIEESQTLLGFYTQADGVWQTARLVMPQKMAELAPEHSADWRDLAVSVLHVLVLDQLLPTACGGEAKCRYVHQMVEVKQAVLSNSYDLIALVPPATMDHVESIAGNREKMPAKSTYFYPKLLTGLVYNSLKVN